MFKWRRNGRRFVRAMKRTPEAIVGVESEGRTFEADGTYRFDSYAVGPCAIVVGKTFMMHDAQTIHSGNRQATNNSRRLRRDGTKSRSRPSSFS